jgi:hypothetical protein
MLARMRDTCINPQLSRPAGTGLSRGNNQSMLFCGDFQRSELLDLAGLQRNAGDVTAWISPGVNGNRNQFRSNAA